MGERTGNWSGKSLAPPIPARTEFSPVVNASPEADEVTKRLTSPGISAAIEELLLHLRAELIAIEANGGDPSAAGDMHVRLALLARDTEDDLKTVLNHCELAGAHPLALDILRSLAHGAGDAQAFEEISGALETRGEDLKELELAAIRSDLADAWLYRFGVPDRASEYAEQAIEVLTGEASFAAQNTYAISLAMLEDWTKLESFHSSSDDAANTAAAAQLTFDRLQDADRAQELAGKLHTQGGELALYGSSLETQLCFVSGANPQELTESLKRRVAVLEAQAGSSAELSATRYSLAESQEQAGEIESAQVTFADLTSKTGWSTSIAQLSALRVATKRRDWQGVVNQLGKLATLAKEESLATAYSRRRAEVLEHSLGKKVDALKAWQKLFSALPTDVALGRNVQRLLMDSPAELVAQLEQLAQANRRQEAELLRKAAAVAETRLADLAAAAALARKCADSSKLSSDLHEIARICSRQGKSHSVAKVYREIANVEVDERVAGPLLLMSSLFELVAGREQESIALLSEAVQRAPRDLAIHLLAANVHRANSNAEALRTSLVSIGELARSPDTRFEAFCELGLLCRTLKDLKGAAAALAKASELRPQDSTLLLALADLHDGNQEWDKTVSLREAAVKVMPAGPDAARVLSEIGRIERVERKDAKAALRAYERSRALEPLNVETLRQCQELYGELQDPKQQLAMFRSELELVEEKGRRLTLYLDVAKVSQLAAEGTEEAIRALQKALEIDANNSTALKGVLDVANQLGQHQLVADAYANARETAANVAILGEAYRQLQNWAAFVEVRRRHIALLANKSAKAAAALEIAEISENALKSTDQAVDAYRLALEFEPANRKSQAALRRLLEQGKAWKELVVAIEAELKTIVSDASTADERVARYCQVAEVQRDQLGRDSESALAYESVLRIDPRNNAALNGLEKLYASLRRFADLLRIKEAKYQAERADGLLQQIAELRERTGDIDGALQAYQGALSADSSNREIFTAMEKLCYGKERWKDVIALYNEVIARVEKGETRAYRLGDLYARRGQVQRQFIKEPAMAAASFLRVIEVDPSDETAMQSLSEIFSERSDWAGLIAAYEKRAELATSGELKVDSLRKAAEIARSKVNDRNETARLFKILAALSPDDAKANATLEEFYTESQNWAELILILEAQLERAGVAGESDSALLQRLAKISEEGLRDETRAIRYYERLIELAPQNRRALDALARIFESTERWTEFVEVTRRLVKVTKDRNVKALLYFKCGSVTEAKFGNEEDAIRYYDAAIKTSPACLPAVHGLRDLYLRRKDWPRVIQTLELEVKLWQDDKERAGVFAQIGRIYGEELVQNDRAMHYYECALAVDPECLPANRALFEHYFDQEHWERAAPLAQALAPKAMRDGDPMRRSEFYRKRGIVASFTGDPVGAAESMVIALEIQPENIAALESLTHLAAVSPRVYDFPGTFRELEKIYRKRAQSQALMARVNVGQAHIMTRAGNLSAAEKLLNEAIERNPGDYSIVEALVNLHAGTRNWSAAVEALEAFLARGPTAEQQVKAMMRQAEIFADGQMDADVAAATLRRVLAIDPANPEVYYLLAQEYFCLERFDDARLAIEKVIELSAVPGANLSAQRLARYYYYLGRILERGGELRAAISQYRRAAEYDPGYAPPALALALRSMRAGDQRAAETRLINSAHAAMGQGDKRSAIPLQRGLARILLKGGDREAAIEAYRGILEVDPEGAADRLSLAEIYAETDLHKAIDEVRRVVEGDLRHGPAYRVLAGYYMQAGEPARATRVLTNMEMLGYSEDQDRKMAQSARAITPTHGLQQGLSNELRLTLMANEALGCVVGELFCLAHQQMATVNPPSSLGDNLIPLPSVEDRALHVAVGDMIRLFGMEPEVYIGENVPGRVIVLGHPRRIIVLDRLVLNEPEAARRFALGWAFEGICAGYATVLHLGEKQRNELGQLLCSLFLPESARSSQANDFMKTLPPGALEIIRRHEGEFLDFDMEAWMDGMNAVARRAGLVACDNLAAAARMLAVLAGESIGEHSSALGTVFCGEDLFQFHVSDQYDQLRAALSRVPTGMPG